MKPKYNIGILELTYTTLSIQGYCYKEKEYVYDVYINDVYINGGLYKMNESAIEQLELLQQAAPFRVY